MAKNKKKKKFDKGLVIGICILVVVVLLFISVCVDMISIYGVNKPVFAVFDKDKNMYRGLFYNTYICPAYSAPKIKINYLIINVDLLLLQRIILL